jgi:periplasmic protein TonB
MNSTAAFDPAERTLWWSLPFGLVLWVMTLLAFGSFFAAPDKTASTPPAAIDARIIELPPPPAPPKLPPKPVVKAAPVAVHAAPQQAPIPPKVVVPVAPPAPPPVHADPAPIPPPPPKPQPSTDSSQEGTRQMGARALYQPKPVVPEELRDETMHVVVTARIHIGTDGNVMVELVKPAPDPRVNRLVLNTLKTWRFFPAIQAGKPVESVQDVKVAIDVD